MIFPDLSIGGDFSEMLPTFGYSQESGLRLSHLLANQGPDFYTRLQKETISDERSIAASTAEGL